MPVKSTTKKTTLQPIGNKTRRNLLTPPPKEVHISKSVLNDDLPEDNKETLPEAVLEPNNPYQSQYQSQYNRRVVSVENVLAAYGYKTMEKLILDDSLQYIRCTNNNGHIVFVDMKNTDYIDDIGGENIIKLKIVDDTNIISSDIKSQSYQCVETDLNGIMLMYSDYYVTLTRDDHNLEPKETTYTRLDGKTLRSTSEELIPFPIVAFEDILEDYNMVDEYIYNVTSRVCTLLYTDREDGIHQMVNNINKLSNDVTEYYDSIIEKINYNSDSIYKLESFKDSFDKMQGNLSKDDRSRLRLILFNLRVVNNVEKRKY